MSRESLPTVVVGAGLGGLAASCHLASRGRRVILFERGESVGGKCGSYQFEGWTFDTGPSVLTLPFVLQELWRSCGREMADYLQLEPVEPGCRYTFADGSQFDAPGTLPALRAAIEARFPGELAGFDRFFRWTRSLWDISEPFFLSQPLTPRAFGRIRPRHFRPAAALVRPGSLRAAIEACFRDPNLVQLFSRFATYNGSDPWRTPAAFAVIAHAEFAFGSWRCVGGMQALARALERLARDLGVEIRTRCGVARIGQDPEGDTVRWIETDDGKLVRAAGVVVNQDALTALTDGVAGELRGLGPLRRSQERREPSIGGAVLLLALEGRTPGLATHNVIFRPDYRREFQDLFQAGTLPGDPTIYVSVPSLAEPSLAPHGCEGWFVLVNAPARPEPDYWVGKDAWLMERLASGPLKLDPGRVRHAEFRPPRWFAEHLGAWKGSLYGPSSNELLAAFRRVPVAGPVGGLAFVGGSAHPGGGVPLVLLGGRMAADVLCARGA